jgi:hypothetical protein
MIEQLTEIRNNILSALEQNDGMLAKMYVNKLDTLLHSAKNNSVKNIHILPTDKPTGIFESKNGLHFSIIEKIRYGEFKGFHIYITSYEEIKEGVEQWYLDKVLNKPYNSGGAQYSSKQDVIILTTDQDLIKDGVQEIDDEFLVWFVNNPSCEWVDVTDWMDTNGNIAFGGDVRYQISSSTYNKIIIPQEEPKQIKCYCGHTITCDCEPLQETLEEAAEMYIQSKNPQWTPYHKQSFKDGAKWQDERSQKIVPFDAVDIEVFAIKPNEDGKLFAYIGYKIANGNFEFNVVPFTEPQAERMYNEEDMINFAHFYFKEEFNSTMQTNKSTKELLSEWFEKFKKK